MLLQCPDLEELRLDRCPRIQGPVIASEKLKTLSLSYTQIPDSKIKDILKSTPNLTRLYLRMCKKINNPSYITTSSLIELSLSGTQVNDTALNAILQHTPNMKILELSCCNNLSSPTSIYQYCPRLYKLDISENMFVTDTFMNSLLKKSTSLRILYARWCPKLEISSNFEVDSINLLLLDLSGCEICKNQTLMSKLRKENLDLNLITGTVIVTKRCVYKTEHGKLVRK